MSRLTRVLLLGLTLLMLLVPALAIAADPLMPGRPSGAPSYSGAPPLYDNEKFPPHAYTFEGDSLSHDNTRYMSQYASLNLLLVTKAWLLKLAIRIAEYALYVDFLTPFLQAAAGALSALGGLFWTGRSPMVTGALSLAGIWAVLLYMRGRLPRVWASLGGSILIVMAAALVLAEGPGWASAANALSRGMTSQVYQAVNGVGADPRGWGLVARSGDSLWNALVYRPWLDGEFGSAAGQQKYGQFNATDSFLGKAAPDRYRYCKEAAEKDLYCPMWGDEQLPRRMLLAGWTLVATVAVAGAIATLSGGIIVAQLALLFLLVLAPVWLLVALWWPEQGQRLLRALWLRALGALVMQSVLAATLGVLMLLSLTVTSVFTDGWMLQSLVLTAFGILAFRYRTAWLEPLTSVSRRAGEVSARLRGDAGRAAQASRHTATVAEGQSGPVAAAPAFAQFPMPAGRAESPSAAPEREREDFPASAAALQHVRLGSSGTAPHLALFRTEMQHLREQITLAEQITPREQIDRSGLAPGEFEWRPMPAAAPDAGPGAIPGRASRPTAAAGRERGNDVERIPTQRPRG